MPVVFSNQAGKVAQIASGNQLMRISVGAPTNTLYGHWQGFHGFKSVITGYSYNQQSGVQIQHTLNQRLYIYNFGERAGDFSLSGVCFPSTCFDSPGNVVGRRSGLEHTLFYYGLNRLSSQGKAITLTLGSDIALKAFLIGLRADMADANMGLAQFSMLFKCVPSYIPQAQIVGLNVPTNTV